MGLQREFLGWDEALLERAADWLHERFGDDMEGVLVAPPGARSGRTLQELLSRKVGARLRPPITVTSGLLTDELLEIGGVPAGRLVRTLAWRQALGGLNAEQLEQIVARPPDRADLAGWMRISEEVRGLFGEVAAEGLDFAKVAGSEMLLNIQGEQDRWLALAEAQQAMVTLLERMDRVDPHIGRLRAINASKRRDVREVVLIGVAEMNALLRGALELCEAPATALVFAPVALEQSFDAFGCIDPAAWSVWNTSLDAEKQWHVVDGPAEQADQVARVIAGWTGQYSAEQISIGLADREVAPYLRGMLAERGAVGRDAAGTPVERTRPAMLLAAIGRFVKNERFADFAQLIRHPDFEAAIRGWDARACGDAETTDLLQPVNLVDDYHNAHLPRKADGNWLAQSPNWNDRALHAGMIRLWSAACSVLDGLRDTTTRSVKVIVPELRRLLIDVYGGRELDPECETDRVLIQSLSQLGDAMTEVESVPDALAPEGSAADAIELLLRSVQGAHVPPPPERVEQQTIEMLGWLELALDDAPALVVTGFEDGKVPESVRGDSYLPNQLRTSLGIVDNEKRLARDLYATELLLQSRKHVAFVTGRRSQAGDPQVPSRIVFHCDDAEVVPRVKRAIGGGRRRGVSGTSNALAVAELPRLDHYEEIESLSVTAFKTFLESPYRFYLEQVLRLQSLDDRARELDPLGFGSLAHKVLQRFGADEQVRDEVDAGRIASFLTAELRRLGAEWFGKSPLPAVHLQLEQLEYRLEIFAEKQAVRRAQGWEIRHVEWKPAAGPLEWVVDDRPICIRGRIDRIDHHPEANAWAIWDYKTGERVDKPAKAHLTRDGVWRDLQLPLYCLLAAELLGDRPPSEIGYIAISGEPEKIGFMPLDKWARDMEFDEGIESALEAIDDVVRRIRKGEFFADDEFNPRDPIFAAIGGVGILEQP